MEISFHTILLLTILVSINYMKPSTSFQYVFQLRLSCHIFPNLFISLSLLFFYFISHWLFAEYQLIIDTNFISVLSALDMTNCINLMIASLFRGSFWCNKLLESVNYFFLLPFGGVISCFSVVATVAVSVGNNKYKHNDKYTHNNK